MKKIKPTADKYEISRFVNTQSLYYDSALKEIKAGKKTTHWMWFIFPQLKELGYSETAKYYGISGLDEAREYMKNKILRDRLIEISKALLELDSNNAEEIFGWPDHMKLKSCMTLFEVVEPENEVYKEVLGKFFNGERCEKTLEVLGR